MLEVVFQKSAAGGLACAQHCGEPYLYSVANPVYASLDSESRPSPAEQEAFKQVEESVHNHRQRAVSIGGEQSDIFCFADDLSIGDISGDCLAQSRLDSISRAFASFPEEDLSDVIDLVQQTVQTLQTLIQRAAAGEIIRIWYSEHPSEFCGLCWLISELHARMQPLPQMRVVKLPNQVRRGNTICRYQGWGEVGPEEFHEFLSLEEAVIPAFIGGTRAKWQELQEQNTPLRAVINGNLQSVPEDFYDFLLERELAATEDEFQEANFIGAILGKYQLAIGAAWIELRIEKMIQNGLLTPLTASAPIGRRTLKKTR